LTLRKLEPVNRHIGQLFFKVFIHQIFILIFGIFFCAVPAAKIDLFSGPFDIELSSAFQAGFLYLINHFNPLYKKLRDNKTLSVKSQKIINTMHKYYNVSIICMLKAELNFHSY